MGKVAATAYWGGYYSRGFAAFKKILKRQEKNTQNSQIQAASHQQSLFSENTVHNFKPSYIQQKCYKGISQNLYPTLWPQADF